MLLTIKITKEVLKESKSCLNAKLVQFPTGMIGQNCAIGKAIYGLFGDTSWVNSNCIVIYKDVDSLLTFSTLPEHEINLPSSAKKFISTFDSLTPEERLLLPEFSFTIDVPDSVIESIGIEEAKAIIEKSSTLELA